MQSKQLKQSDERQGEDGDDDGDDDDNDGDADDDGDIDVPQSYDYKHGGRCNPLLAGARPVPARYPPTVPLPLAFLYVSFRFLSAFLSRSFSVP